MRLQLISGAVLSLAGSALAQFPANPLQGFTYNLDRPQIGSGLSYVTRGNNNAGQILCRYDRDDYREWGLNTAATPQTQIQGAVAFIQDQNDGTVEQFSLVGYGEDPARANFPLLTPPVFNLTGINMPPTVNPPGPRAYRLGVAFAAPFTFPTTADIFLGVGVPALISTTGPTDGLYVGVVSVNNPAVNPTTFDLPGPAGQFPGGSISNGSYTCYVLNTATPPGTANYATASATSLEQPAFDWLVSGGTAGGVALAQTNQSTYAVSNAPQGTSDFISGLHPDINGANAGRADNLGFAVTIHNSQVAAGQPVFVLMALGPSPIGSLPISSFPAAANSASAGNVCIDFTTAATFLGILAPAGTNGFATLNEAQIIVALSPQTRAVINTMASPLNLWWQGFVFDGTATGPGLEVRTTGCVIQHLK